MEQATKEYRILCFQFLILTKDVYGKRKSLEKDYPQLVVKKNGLPTKSQIEAAEEQYDLMRVAWEKGGYGR